MKEIIEKVFEEKMKNGRFEEIVGSEIEKMFQEATRDALGWNSTLRKTLQNKIEAVMSNAFEQTNFNSYVDAFKIVINSILEDTSLGAYKQMACSLKELLGENTKAPKEIKLSEIFKKFTSCVENMSIDSNDDLYSNDGESACVNCVMDIKKDEFLSNQLKITLKVERCNDDDESLIFDTKYEFVIARYYRDKYGYVQFGGTSLQDLRLADEFMRYLMKLSAGFTHVIIDDLDGFEEEVSVNVER